MKRISASLQLTRPATEISRISHKIKGNNMHKTFISPTFFSKQADREKNQSKNFQSSAIFSQVRPEFQVPDKKRPATKTGFQGNRNTIREKMKSIMEKQKEQSKVEFKNEKVISSLSNSLQKIGKVKTEQLIDEQFIDFLELVKKAKGFRGSNNTHARNQIMYLTPQRRMTSSDQQLVKIKQNLYSLINKESVSNCVKTEPAEILANEGKSENKQNLIEYLTEYNPQGSFQNHKSQQRSLKKKIQGNMIRERLKEKNKECSAYRERMKSYQRTFNESKIIE